MLIRGVMRLDGDRLWYSGCRRKPLARPHVPQRASGVPVFFDLAELRAYNYQSGMVFAMFVPGRGQEIARGGRYDNIGQVFIHQDVEDVLNMS